MAKSVPDPASASDAWREHGLSQLRYFRALSLRAKLEAVQGMADVVRRFQQMRREASWRQSESSSTENRHDQEQ
jgi:hypothetical protein